MWSVPSSHCQDDLGSALLRDTVLTLSSNCSLGFPIPAVPPLFSSHDLDLLGYPSLRPSVGTLSNSSDPP